MEHTPDYEEVLLICNFDYEQRSWGQMPDVIWKQLLIDLPKLSVTSFGLQDVHDLAAIRSFPLFRNVPLKSQGMREYSPYHAESSRQIMSFEIDEVVRSVILSEDFDQWNRGNDDLCVDELVFFTSESAKVLAVPYENIIKFFDLSRQELQAVNELDPRVSQSLYDKDLKQLKLIGGTIM